MGFQPHFFQRLIPWTRTLAKRPPTEYTYSPLRGTKIRLFKAQLSEDGTISGHLEAFNFSSGIQLSSIPPYQALSYAWGTSIASKHVVLKNNQELRILDSVDAFLRHNLSSTKRDDRGEEGWWWIDSICINQADEREKAGQVALMGKIYQTAKTTRVWLGEESEDSARAIKFLNWMSGQNVSSGQVSEELVEDLQAKDGPYAREWTAVKSLFRRAWWRRVWTVQEFVISKKLEIHCGDAYISREAFQQALEAVYDCGVHLGSATQWNRGRLETRYNEVGAGSAERSSLSLVATLAYLSDHQATDPRDRVYSLSGIVRDAELAGYPDYTQSVELLYTKLVKAFVEKYHSLDIICFATTFHNDSDNASEDHLPSWAPDWRVSVFPLVVPMMVSQGTGNAIGNLRPRRFRSTALYAASRSLPPEASFSADLREMNALGFVLDTIDGLTGLPPVQWESSISPGYESVQSDSKSSTCADDMTQTHDHDSLTSAEASDIMLSIMRCLTLGKQDHYLNDSRQGPEFLAEFQALLSMAREGDPALRFIFQNWYTANQALRVKRWNLDTITAKFLEGKIINFNLPPPTWRRSFYSRFHDTVVKMARRLVILQSGSFATVPMRARKGDVICTLFGCRVPVVLRRRGGEEDVYSFIGECYVDGYMNGEALENFPDEEKYSFRII